MSFSICDLLSMCWFFICLGANSDKTEKFVFSTSQGAILWTVVDIRSDMRVSARLSGGN